MQFIGQMEGRLSGHQRIVAFVDVVSDFRFRLLVIKRNAPPYGKGFGEQRPKN